MLMLVCVSWCIYWCWQIQSYCKVFLCFRIIYAIVASSDDPREDLFLTFIIISNRLLLPDWWKGWSCYWSDTFHLWKYPASLFPSSRPFHAVPVSDCLSPFLRWPADEWKKRSVNRRKHDRSDVCRLSHQSCDFCLSVHSSLQFLHLLCVLNVNTIQRCSELMQMLRLCSFHAVTSRQTKRKMMKPGWMLHHPSWPWQTPEPREWWSGYYPHDPHGNASTTRSHRWPRAFCNIWTKTQIILKIVSREELKLPGVLVSAKTSPVNSQLKSHLYISIRTHLLLFNKLLSIKLKCENVHV